MLGSRVPRTGLGDRRGEIVVEVVQEHAPSLLRIARRHSICVADAQDAYQRALEIFLKRVDTLERATIPGWLKTVVKHEAMAVREQRERHVGRSDIDLDQSMASELPGVEERVERFEQLERSAEALQRLKPQELTALLLKAEGHTYLEICDLTGWTYTKVNRCITEGRRRFRDRLDKIESGAECERWAELLSAVADGEASAEDLAQLRPHLRNCQACRATVRAYRVTPHHVAAVLPVGGALVLGAGQGSGHLGQLARLSEAIVNTATGRAMMLAHKLQTTLEAATGGKVAAIAASTAALAGGSVVVEQVTAPVRPHQHVHHVAVGTNTSVSPVAVAQAPVAVKPSSSVSAAGHHPASSGRGSEFGSHGSSRDAPAEFRPESTTAAVRSSTGPSHAASASSPPPRPAPPRSAGTPAFAPSAEFGP
jgi:RNA polymerase sigma factor (sigma-70 family)